MPPVEPRTWRCVSCGALYVDRQPNGMAYFHACGTSARDYITGARLPAGARRDENIVQDRPGGPSRIQNEGAGRDLVGLGDLVSGATSDELNVLRAAPAIVPVPPSEDRRPEDPRRGFPAPPE